jgi:hypothetical protein
MTIELKLDVCCFFFDDTLTFRLKSYQVTIHSCLTIQWYAGPLWSWSYSSWIYNYCTCVISAGLNNIASKVVSSNPVHGEVYSIQHYVMKLVCDFWCCVSIFSIFINGGMFTDGYIVAIRNLKLANFRFVIYMFSCKNLRR